MTVFVVSEIRERNGVSRRFAIAFVASNRRLASKPLTIVCRTDPFGLAEPLTLRVLSAGQRFTCMWNTDGHDPHYTIPLRDDLYPQCSTQHYDLPSADARHHAEPFK